MTGEMASYTIKELERLSRVKAHTIRIWERRYALLNPGRSGTNIRRYSDEDLRKLLNVSLLNRHGLKISKIAGLSDTQIGEQVLALENGDTGAAAQMESLILAMTELDEARFEKVMSTSILRIGFEETLVQLLQPFLQRVGVLWQIGAVKPGQEHFISNLIRQKTVAAIDGTVMPVREDPRGFVLFLPEGELHELGLLFSSYLLRKWGHRTIYLGQTVPLPYLEATVERHKPDAIITAFVSGRNRKDVIRYLHEVHERLPSLPVLFFSSESLKEIALRPGHKELFSIQDLKEYAR
ncbi:MAG TPA: MerR family transcriptional regulator [Flavobacteriales bacterium]|nr:MerR family transcriptional regulator [Flavobacteriales bacterium]